MNFREIASRLTGISVPVFGVQWNPPEAEVAVARRVISFLEDRRVLYAPHAFEVPAHCVESAKEIRRELTDEIGRLSGDTRLRGALQGIRRAAREFVTQLGDASECPTQSFIGHPFDAARFGIALGELRAGVGTYVAILASTYGIDVEGDLERVLPAQLLDRDTRRGR